MTFWARVCFWYMLMFMGWRLMFIVFQEKGEMFGEEALVANFTAGATAVAEGPVECMALDRTTFTEVSEGSCVDGNILDFALARVVVVAILRVRNYCVLPFGDFFFYVMVCGGFGFDPVYSSSTPSFQKQCLSVGSVFIGYLVLVSFYYQVARELNNRGETNGLNSSFQAGTLHDVT